jgi:hypothetical protein
MLTRRSIPLLALLAACSSARPPDARHAPPPAIDHTTDATIDANLDALLSHGEALSDHVGPDAARAIDEDLARRPAIYLAALERRYLAQPLGPGAASLHYATALWRLRRPDDARARHIASRFFLRYQELRRGFEGTPNPYGDGMRRLALIRDGVDVATDARWRTAPTEGVSACTASAPSGAALLVAARGCTCGESFACSVALRDGALHVALRVDPDAMGVCTDCYPTATACTLPTLPAGVTLRVVVNDAAVTTWRTDARGAVVDAACPTP